MFALGLLTFIWLGIRGLRICLNEARMTGRKG